MERWTIGSYATAAAALATGAALLIFFLTRLSLLLAMAGTIAISTVALRVATSVFSQTERSRLWVRAQRGLGVALAATIAYDGLRWLLVWVFGLAGKPWEAIPEFGRLLAGESATPAVAWSVGMIFHLANGLGFGTAHAMVVKHPGVVSGVLWAVCLEALMLTFYPGWLDIRAIEEFVSISMAGHVAYGATLGWLGRQFVAGRR